MKLETQLAVIYLRIPVNYKLTSTANWFNGVYKCILQPSSNILCQPMSFEQARGGGGLVKIFDWGRSRPPPPSPRLLRH